MAKIKKKTRRGRVPLGEKRPIRVDLHGAPSAVVEASDTGEAWQLYMKLCGIVSTDHRPRFSRPGADCETDENGIVLTPSVHKRAHTAKPDNGEDDWDVDDLLPADDDGEE